MPNLIVVNFILHYFMAKQQTTINIFNCWPKQIQEDFVEKASQELIFIQFINLNATPWDYEMQKNFFINTQHDIGVFMDMNCLQSLNLIELANELLLINEHYHWLIYDEFSNLTEFHETFKSINLAIDAELTFAILGDDSNGKSNESLTFIQYDVYNNGYLLGGSLNMTIDREVECNRSSCVLGKYLSDLHSRSKYGNRDRLNDTTFRVATVVTKRSLETPTDKLLEYLRSTNDPSVDVFPKFGFILNDIIRDLLYCNMSYHFTETWSINATHGGSIGALVTETADFASTPFILTAERLKYVVPLQETNSFRSVCLFRTPRNNGFNAGVLFLPFEWPVWLTFSLMLLVLAVLLWGAFYLEYHHHLELSYLQYVPSLLSTILISISVACQQGSNMMPRLISGRVAFITLLTLSFIMYNFYTSLVVSILLGKPIKSSISSLQELADSPLDVGFEPLPFTFTYLNTSMLPSVRHFVKRKIEDKHSKVWMSAEEGLLRVRDRPGFVFVSEISILIRIIERLYEQHEICDLNQVMLRPEKSIFTHLNRHSRYIEVLRLRLLRMLETGVYAKHHRYWSREKLQCFGNSNFLVEVGVEYTAFLFILLAAFYVIVWVILLLEILWKRNEAKINNWILKLCTGKIFSVINIF